MHEGHRLERPIGARCIQNHPTGSSSTCQHQWTEAGDRGEEGQPRLRRGASLHFSTNTQSRKWSSPAAGGNQLVSDVIPHSRCLVGWPQSHGLAVRINNHEGRDWLVGWRGRGWVCCCDWSKRQLHLLRFEREKKKRSTGYKLQTSWQAQLVKKSIESKKEVINTPDQHAGSLLLLIHTFKPNKPQSHCWNNNFKHSRAT